MTPTTRVAAVAQEYTHIGRRGFLMRGFWICMIVILLVWVRTEIQTRALMATTKTGEFSSKSLDLPLLQEYAKTALPAAGMAGRLARVTDELKSFYKDTGREWLSLSNRLDVAESAAGGAGTPDSPWTGWESTVNGAPAGATMYLRSGFYLQGTRLNLKADQTLVGDGWNSVIQHTGVLTSSTIGAVIEADGVHNIKVRDLKIRGSASVTSLFNPEDKGIGFRRVTNGLVVNIWVEGVAGEAIYSVESNTAIRLLFNKVSDSAHNCLNFNGATGRALVIGNECLDTKQGIEAAGDHMVISENIFARQRGFGIVIGNWTAAGHAADVVIVSNNTIFDGQGTGYQAGILLQCGWAHVIVTGNLIYNNPGRGIIAAGANCKPGGDPNEKLVISNNIVADNGRSGVNEGVLLSRPNILVTGNLVLETPGGQGQATGIHLDGSSATFVHGNYVSGHGTDLRRTGATDAVVGDNYIGGALSRGTGQRIGAFADGDARPSVKDANLFKAGNSGKTTITTFTEGVAGQVITIVFTNGNTSITDSRDIKLSGPFTPMGGDTMSLIFDGTTWYELTRSRNSGRAASLQFAPGRINPNRG